MTIKIIEEPHLHLTQSEYAYMRREWERACRFTTEPPTFEDFVRRKIGGDRLDLAALGKREGQSK